ncbi:hypothetical protein ACT6NV_13315 [Robiginitalea sp. IMCC44478]|uniref:hypothetical protein n=1 Tax=Robiginitalea sp. IMCC44478 TaxID=3459122 RepID=UPI004041E913
MHWDVSHSKELQVLLLNFKGKHSAESIFKASETIIRESRRLKLYKLLVIATDFTTDSTPTEIFRLPYEYYAKWGLHPSSRIAVLEPADLNARQIANFYEISSRNLGWEVKVFGNRKRALKWLNGSH